MDKFKNLTKNLPAFKNWQWFTALMVITFIAWLPLIVGNRLVDIGDWSLFSALFEALRKDIVEFGQFPFWNPWHFGGTPLFARPQIGTFSIEALCIIIFGTINGLRIAMFIYALLGAAGMWLLLGDFVKTPTARFWGAMTFALQGAIACHIAAGHPVMIIIMLVPYILFGLRRVAKSFGGALLLGGSLAMMINHSLHYVSLTMAAFIGIYLAVLAYKNMKSKTFWLNLCTAGSLCLALCAYRLILTLHLLSQFSRRIDMRADVSVWDFLLALVYPGQSLFTFDPPLKLYWGWLEIGCYTGVLTLIMFFISLKRGFKWWHAGAILTALLTINSTSKFLPGYWVRELPGFSSFFCITRWRMLMMFFIALGCACGVDWLTRTKLYGKKRRVIYLLLVISAAGYLWNMHVNWRDCNYITEKELIETLKGDKSETFKTVNIPEYNRYAAVHNNIALLFAYEPLFGYIPNKHNARLVASSPAYGGEFYAARGKINKVVWSPNRIVLDVDPGTVVLVNQNPGSYWRDGSGNKMFPEMRIFEVDEMFFVNSGNSDQIVLELVPPLHEFALGVTAVSAIVFLLLLLYSHRKNEAEKFTDSSQ